MRHALTAIDETAFVGNQNPILEINVTRVIEGVRATAGGIAVPADARLRRHLSAERDPWGTYRGGKDVRGAD